MYNIEMAINWNEEDLIQMIRSGVDKKINDAIKVMLLNSEEIVWPMIRYKGGKPEDVQDILDDTALAIVSIVQNGKFDRHKGDLKQLFFGIIHNKVKDILKRRYRQNQRETSLDASVSLPTHLHHNLIEEELFTKESQELIRRGLEHMPEACRELLEKKWLKGYPLKIIAAQLEITEEAVKQRHKRYKKRLKDWLEKNGGYY